MQADLSAYSNFLRSVQVTRSDIIYWILYHGSQAESHYGSVARRRNPKRVFLEDFRKRPVKTLSADFAGLFVRLLVQVDGGEREEYRVGRVLGVRISEAYGGFSFDDSHCTRIVLQVLHDELVPNEASARARRNPIISDECCMYQLTTVSNTAFQLDEVQKWRLNNPHVLDSVIARPLSFQSSSRDNVSPRMRVESPLLFGTYAANDLLHRVRAIRNVSSAALQAAEQATPPDAYADSQLSSGQSAEVVKGHVEEITQDSQMDGLGDSRSTPLEILGDESTPNVDEATQETIISQTEKLSVSKSFDSAFLEEMQRDVEEEYKESAFVVPKELAQLSATQCRHLEKEISDYLENIKQSLARFKSMCIICMENDAVVLLLPCKHKILCRGCGTKVFSCPMCRKPIREVFEPLHL